MSVERAKSFLKEKDLDEKIIVLNEKSATVLQAAVALGVSEDEIAKTLSFIVDDKPILIVAEGTARIDNKKYKQTFHTKAKMIPFDSVEELTGHAPGGVCPFGVNDGVKIYFDESIKRFEKVYPAAGNDHTAVELTVDQLETAVEPEAWVDVTKIPE